MGYCNECFMSIPVCLSVHPCELRFGFYLGMESRVIFSRSSLEVTPCVCASACVPRVLAALPSREHRSPPFHSRLLRVRAGMCVGIGALQVVGSVFAHQIPERCNFTELPTPSLPCTLLSNALVLTHSAVGKVLMSVIPTAFTQARCLRS